MDNGDEYGWQAKFFDSIGVSQWRQIEESFKTAFKKHPRLVKYFICIPLDRADPKIKGKKSFKEKWDAKVFEWAKYADSKSRIIEFEYWGSSELLHRLAFPKHAGRLRFWFNKEEFTDDWFSEKLDRSIDSLGDRYTPAINFDLDIAKAFDGIAHDDGFKKQFIKLYDELLQKSAEAITTNGLRNTRLKEVRESLQKSIQELRDKFNEIDFEEIRPIGFNRLLDICEELRKQIYKGLDVLRDLRDKEKSAHDEFGHAIYPLQQFEDSVDFFAEFLTGKTAALSNLPVLILEGEAGMGKSHLLADIALKRREKGQPSLLLLGQHFASDENP